MKTFSLVLNVVLLASTIFLAVKLNQKSDEGLVEDASRWKIIQQGAEAYRKRTEAPFKEALRVVTNPFSDPAIAKSYINNFMSDLDKIRDHCDAGTYPTTSMWIDAAAIYRMAEYMAKSGGIADGVSLYFAKYGVLNSADGDYTLRTSLDNGKYNKQYTTVVVVTKNDGRGSHVPYLTKVAGKYAAGEVYEGLYNYHDLCPPNTNCIPPIF
jgi:hypothetical protein